MQINYPSMAEDTVEILFTKLRKPDFLAMKGLSGEVPIFIHTYEAKAEHSTRQIGDRAILRTRHLGRA